MKVAIIGSRTRQDKQNVVDLVNSLPEDAVVISGGCRGVDTWAAEAAKARGLMVCEYLPNLPAKGSARHEFTKAYYARNKLIAEAADVVYAFVSADRKGGTENTIGHAKKAGTKVIIL